MSDDVCAGLTGGCPDCRERYLEGLRLYANMEPIRGICVLCDGRHWPWEDHQPLPSEELT